MCAAVATGDSSLLSKRHLSRLSIELMSQDRVAELLTENVPVRRVDTVGLWSAFSPPPPERKALSLESSLRVTAESRAPRACGLWEAWNKSEGEDHERIIPAGVIPELSVSTTAQGVAWGCGRDNLCGHNEDGRLWGGTKEWPRPKTGSSGACLGLSRLETNPM